MYSKILTGNEHVTTSLSFTIIHGLNSLIPSVGSSGQINYAYCGGIAMNLYGNTERSISDIDVSVLNKDISFSLPHTFKSFTIDNVGGFKTFKSITTEDICICTLEDEKFALYKPEYLLLSKIAELPVRKKDLQDALWIIKNIDLDVLYFEKAIRDKRIVPLDLAVLKNIPDENSLFRYLVLGA